MTQERISKNIWLAQFVETTVSEDAFSESGTSILENSGLGDLPLIMDQ